MSRHPYRSNQGSESEEERKDAQDPSDDGLGQEPDSLSDHPYEEPQYGTGLRRTVRASSGNRHSRRRRIGLSILLILAVLIAVNAAYLAVVTRNDDLWLDLSQIPYKTQTIIYGREEGGDWQQYAVLNCTQNKKYVSGDRIPQALKDAFIAVEDKQFFSHHGINFPRTVYAVFNEIKYRLTGSYFGGESGYKIGASTIDQQLVKNLTRDDADTGFEGYLRKVREIWRSLKLDFSYDKDTILTAYLNTISFTDNTAGVEAESEKLFGVSADQLTLAQCASIAAITRNPSRYDPVNHPENNLSRRNYILDEMLGEGTITQQEHDSAVAEPLVITGTGSDPVRETEVTSYFTDALMEDVVADYVSQRGITRSEAFRLLYDGGLRIYATVVPSLQSAMEAELTSASVYPRPTVSAEKTKTDDKGNTLTDADGNPIIEAVSVQPQAAMVSLNYSGEECAVVGGLGEKTVSLGFNRATQAVRQVGSTMKPIGAYVLAVQKNLITWSSSFLDAPVRQMPDEETGELKDWPANYSETYSQQQVLVADALARSINTIAVRVGEKVGVDAIYNFETKELGITSFGSKDRYSGPMILGSSTSGVTPLQMAAAYSIFGNGGIYTTPHSYINVSNGTAKILIAPKVTSRQVIDPDTATIMNRLLAGVMTGDGTASGYSVNDGMDSVGKTGTTSNNWDHWFMGLTPYYVTASWYGYDEDLPLAVNFSAHPPTLAWRNVMRAAQQGLAVRTFPVDATVQKAEYCTVTGELAGPDCPHATGYYKKDHLPQQTCSGSH